MKVAKVTLRPSMGPWCIPSQFKPVTFCPLAPFSAFSDTYVIPSGDLIYVAVENGPVEIVVVFPRKMVDLSTAMLRFTRGYIPFISH